MSIPPTGGHGAGSACGPRSSRPGAQGTCSCRIHWCPCFGGSGRGSVGTVKGSNFVTRSSAPKEAVAASPRAASSSPFGRGRCNDPSGAGEESSRLDTAAREVENP